MLGAKQTSTYTLDYINKSLGITRDLDSSALSAREAANAFLQAEQDAEYTRLARVAQYEHDLQEYQNRLRNDPQTIEAIARGQEHARIQAEYDQMAEELRQEEERRFQEAQQRANAYDAMQYQQQLQDAADAERQFVSQNSQVLESINAVDAAFNRLAMIGLQKLRQAFREALTEMKNVDSALVVVRKVTDFTDEQLESLRSHAYEIGKDYGVTASEYLDAVAEMSRAGYKEQSADLAELAVKLQLVGDVSQKTANQFIIATDKAYGFKGSAEELATVIDQINEIDNNFATSIQKIADGIGIVAPIASQAHVSIEELEAAIGTITATTQRSGAESARALRALFLNIIGDTKTEIEDGATWTAGEIEGLRDVLKLYASDAVEAAEATGQVVNPMKAIGALAESYKNGVLTEARLMEMISDIGGKLRSSQLMALIQNWDMYNDMLDKTKTAVGSADREVQRALNSWEKKINILTNTWTDFVQKTLSSDLVKNLLDFATKALESFGDLGTVLELLALTQLPKVVTGFQTISTAISNVSTWALHLGGNFSGLIASLTNFKSLSSAAAQGSDQLAHALSGVNVGASSAAAGIGAAVAMIAIATVAWKSYIKSLDESIDKAEKAKQQYDSISDLEEKYDALHQAVQDGEPVFDEYKDAQDKLIEKLKDEGTWVDRITGKYEGLHDKIKAATAAALGYRKVELTDALDAATKKLQIKIDNGETYYDAVDNFLYGTHRRYENKKWWEAPDTISIENLIDLYDKAIERRAELEAQGSHGSDEDNWLKQYIEWFGDEIEDYRLVNELLGEAKQATDDITDSTDGLVSKVEEEAHAFIGLKDEIVAATEALQKYNDAIAGGEHGDTLKQYATVYKQAKEMYEKGLYGSSQYQAALDLLLPDSLKSQLGYDYKALGDEVFGEFASGAWEALYGSGGEDYGSILATYLRDNADGMQSMYEVINDNGESFDLLIHDEDALAKQLGMTTEQIYAFMDALDIHHSDVMVSTKDIEELISKYGDVNKGIITDGTGMINQLVKDGRTESEIRNIIDQLDRAGQLDMGSLPEDISDAIAKFEELKKTEADLPKESVIEIKTDPESGFFDKVIDEINLVNGKKIVIGVSYKVSNSDVIQSNWQGVNSAKAGPSLINEKGAELIVRGNKAFTVNNGNPAIFQLRQGDKIFNAKETENILGGTKSKTSIAGGIKATYIEDDNGDDSTSPKPPSNSGKKGNSGSGGLDLLALLEEYMKELLSKAKKALDEQIDAIDAQIDALKKQHDAEEEANELEELRLKILEAEKNLVDANVERTVRYFNKATGQWEWMADQKAVAQAQKALEDAQQNYYDKLAEIEYQAKLDELQAQKDALKESYNNLSESWNDIKDEISKALNQKDVIGIAEILSRLGLTAARGYVPNVNTLIGDINSFTGSFDNGGFAFGKGLLRKGISQGETILDESITNRILSPMSNMQFTNFTNSLTKLFGMSSGDIGAKAQSLISSIDRSSSIAGDTYYINGVRIGSDMIDRPLSEILSVLPIYAG
jgi:TP901 family phage tail tape measure protein